MNQWQIAQQIKYLLEQRKWDDNVSNTVVFGKVVVSSMSMEDLIRNAPIVPFAAIRMGPQTHDNDFPELVLDGGIDVEIAVRVANDPFGQSDLIGGVRLDLTKSQGRGIGEVIAEVHGAIKRNDNETGISLFSRNASDTNTLVIGRHNYFSKTVEVSSKGGVSRFFHPARELANSSGTLSWILPPDRFDRKRVVLRYASGSTPPSSPTAGSSATLAADLSTSYVHGTDGQGSGTFSYALFGAYDYTGNGVIDEHSASITLTGTF